MDFITFNYKKSDTDITKRSLIRLGKPSTNHFGIDVSELDNEDQVGIYYDLLDAKKKYDEEVAQIMEEYDLKYNFRQFIPEKMQDTRIEEL